MVYFPLSGWPVSFPTVSPPAADGLKNLDPGSMFRKNFQLARRSMGILSSAPSACEVVCVRFVIEKKSSFLCNVANFLFRAVPTTAQLLIVLRFRKPGLFLREKKVSLANVVRVRQIEADLIGWEKSVESRAEAAGRIITHVCTFRLSFRRMAIRSSAVASGQWVSLHRRSIVRQNRQVFSCCQTYSEPICPHHTEPQAGALGWSESSCGNPLHNRWRCVVRSRQNVSRFTSSPDAKSSSSLTRVFASVPTPQAVQVSIGTRRFTTRTLMHRRPSVRWPQRCGLRWSKESSFQGDQTSNGYSRPVLASGNESCSG